MEFERPVGFTEVVSKEIVKKHYLVVQYRAHNALPFFFRWVSPYSIALDVDAKELKGLLLTTATLSQAASPDRAAYERIQRLGFSSSSRGVGARLVSQPGRMIPTVAPFTNGQYLGEGCCIIPMKVVWLSELQPQCDAAAMPPQIRQDEYLVLPRYAARPLAGCGSVCGQTLLRVPFALLADTALVIYTPILYACLLFSVPSYIGK